MLLTYLFPGYEVMVDIAPVTEEGISAPSLGCLLTSVCDQLNVSKAFTSGLLRHVNIKFKFSLVPGLQLFVHWSSEHPGCGTFDRLQQRSQKKKIGMPLKEYYGTNQKALRKQKLKREDMLSLLCWTQTHMQSSYGMTKNFILSGKASHISIVNGSSYQTLHRSVSRRNNLLLSLQHISLKFYLQL